ncbi:MAG: NAD(P)-dependent oxidoreductase [Burkholderiaceae bacterium]|jgi:3-hydroxyisobutyrate dehydrogenase-like beta-hydroxyacid dehydrogenase
MSKITFLGLGAMGTRMVPHLIKGGHDVTVWNRSPGPVVAAVAVGARVAASPRAAAVGADLVLTMLTDDAASEAVWMDAQSGALSGLSKKAIAVEISTISPGWVKTLAAAVERRGSRLLDAPVVGSLTQAASAQLISLVGGTEEAFTLARPVLDCIAATVHHVGPQGQGIAMKLAANTLLAVQLAAIAETLSTLDKLGISPARAMEIIGEFPVMSAAGKAFAGLMVAGDFAPRFTAALLAKDLRYAVADATRNEARIPLLTATRNVFDALCDKGFGGENVSAVVKAYRV